MNWNHLLRWGLTLGVVGLAAFMLYGEYRAYFKHPWTRDGLVQAKVITITPRVTGAIRATNVRANQAVRAGDVLFELDDAPFQSAVHKARAELARQQALARLAVADAERARNANEAAPGAIAPEALQQLEDQAIAAKAGVDAANAVLNLAHIQLGYTRITAPADGYITNLILPTGSLAAAGQPMAALIDKTSFRVDGFFRETQLRGIKAGDTAMVTLMGYPDTPLEGKVTSIDWGIAQQNGSPGQQMLPVVSPTFEWIRLAQRVPVRVKLANLPEEVTLRVGTTASILIKTRPDEQVPPLPSALQ